MKKITSIICIVLFSSTLIFIISCGDNTNDSEETTNLMYDVLYTECLSGNEGDANWEAYCKCSSEKIMEAVPNMEDWANMSEEEGYEIGIKYGMECLYLLE